MSSLYEPVAGLDNLFQFRDCCNVYMLKDGNHAILFDLGSGTALSSFKQFGGNYIDVHAVYYTHAHRDQCQGAPRATSQGITLHFPKEARDFVTSPDRPDLNDITEYRRSYPGRFEPPRPFVGGEFDMQGGDSFSWRGYNIEVIAVPGHIDHQLAFFVDIGDERVCLCGDAFHAPGKMWEAYHLETDHYTGAGVRSAMESLRKIKQQRPTVLCPSHGDVLHGGCWDAIEETIAGLRTLSELKDSICPGRPAGKRLVECESDTLIEISPHLLMWNNTYFLLSETGGAMMIDAQGPLPVEFHEHWAKKAGDRIIEAVLVTHPHCDHVEGIPPLQAWQRTQGHPVCQVWAHERVAACVESPFQYRRPFMPIEPVAVDRRFTDRERISWQGYQFTAYDMPGQTDLHAAYATTIDGHKVVFSGDNFFPPQKWGGMGGLSGYNGGHPDLWRGSITRMMAIGPEWVLASHMQPHPYRREDYEAMLQWTGNMSAAMHSISPDNGVVRHHNPHFIGLHPHAQRIVDGEGMITAWVMNPYDNDVEVSLKLVLPGGISVETREVTLTVPPDQGGEVVWGLSVSEASQRGRTNMVTVDVTYDGVYLGEKAACYVIESEPTVG
jgi:glyoxylase-like metal-dependent hydrolase (beta-lactamase superfamily II)